MTDFQAIMADFAVRQAERAAQAQSEIQRLKAAISAPLRNAEIARVEIRFDGCGDSGAVEECVFSDAGGASVPCPEVTIDCAGEGDDQSLNSALEQLTYLALERHHPGWEINDGACGELMIEVATPSFVLDCQLRYTATDDHSTDL